MVGAPGSGGEFASARHSVSEPQRPTIPTAFALRQNQPNPFSGRTTIHFDLAIETPVRLTIYDAQGRVVRKLVDGTVAAGFQSVVWDRRDGKGRQVGAGIYLYRIEAGTFRDRKKMVLLSN